MTTIPLTVPSDPKEVRTSFQRCVLDHSRWTTFELPTLQSVLERPRELCRGAFGKGSAPTLRQALQFCAVREGLGPQLLMEPQSHRAAELGHWGEDACLYWKGRVEEGLPRVSECPGRVLCDREEGGPVHSSAQSDL